MKIIVAGAGDNHQDLELDYGYLEGNGVKYDYEKFKWKIEDGCADKAFETAKSMTISRCQDEDVQQEILSAVIKADPKFAPKVFEIGKDMKGVLSKTILCEDVLRVAPELASQVLEVAKGNDFDDHNRFILLSDVACADADLLPEVFAESKKIKDPYHRKRLLSIVVREKKKKMEHKESLKGNQITSADIINAKMKNSVNNM